LAAGAEVADEGVDAGDAAGATAAEAAGAGAPGLGSELVNGSVELMIWGKVARSAAPGSREMNRAPFWPQPLIAAAQATRTRALTRIR